MPLQSKVSVTLLFAVAAFIGLSYLILRILIAPAFDDLEMQAAHSDLVRAEQAIQTDIDNLEAVTEDWAPWDDIHDYVRGVNPGFRKSNLDRPTLTNLGLESTPSAVVSQARRDGGRRMKSFRRVYRLRIRPGMFAMDALGWAGGPRPAMGRHNAVSLARRGGRHGIGQP